MSTATIPTSEKTILSCLVQSPRVRIWTLRYSSPGAEVIENGCLPNVIVLLLVRHPPSLPTALLLVDKEENSLLNSFISIIYAYNKYNICIHGYNMYSVLMQDIWRNKQKESKKQWRIGRLVDEVERPTIRTGKRRNSLQTCTVHSGIWTREASTCEVPTHFQDKRPPI